MNRTELKGHLGKDAVTRHFPNNGGCIVTFPLSTTEKWRDKATGEQRTKTTWHQVVVKNQQAEWIDGHLKKGMLVAVIGQLDNRSYEGDGVTKYVTEVVVSSFQHSIDVVQKLQHARSSIPPREQHTGQRDQQQMPPCEQYRQPTMQQNQHNGYGNGVPY